MVTLFFGRVREIEDHPKLRCRVRDSDLMFANAART